ncbi:MAG: FAD-dependent oxidoreductase [Verrucomicrobiaceae bacterium]|nr:FAD-dependent oxidoreductase [Verrucomicrobiaceae bacterium]
MKPILFFITLLASPLAAETLQADLLIVGGDESGCAAAVQAARLGVKRIVLVNDIDWLGGQFCTQGIGPIDEWTIVNGKRAEFPISGAFREIIDRIHAHNVEIYGIATPGNGWCGRNTIEPQSAATIFGEWLMDAGFIGATTSELKAKSYPLAVLRHLTPVKVEADQGRVTSVTFHSSNLAPAEDLTVKASLVVDSSDWGDVIRLSGAGYMAGPDLKSRFNEPSAPESLDEGGDQEMNPISWCPLLREAGRDSTIAKPARYDSFAFGDQKKTPPWVEWDGSGGIYNMAGWCIYTHRRMVDRYHNDIAPGAEAVVLNWPSQDYPLSTLPQHVVDALEKDEAGASKKNIVAMTPTQRSIVFEDAKQRALEFVYWLQTEAHDRVGDFPQSFRYMKLADDYGTSDHLPPKPYIREGLRLDALYVLREQDVRTEVEKPLWAKSMPFDGVLGYQFNMDFHPTRRKFQNDDKTKAWQPKFFGTRNWNSHSDRAMFPLRGLVPVKMDGLLGCSKNIGVTSMVQSSLRLHGQMMHVGSAVGTVAAMALKAGIQPREIASSPPRVREVQRTLLRQGTLIWPWHDVRSDEPYFEAANLLTIAGIWRADTDNVFFKPEQSVTRRELAGALVRLIRATSSTKDWTPLPQVARFTDVPANTDDRIFIETMITWGDFGQQPDTFQPNSPVTWSTLNRWLGSLKLPTFKTLTHNQVADYPLTRAECVDFLYRVLQHLGERLPARYDSNPNDPMPFDDDNDKVPDHLQPPH